MIQTLTHLSSVLYKKDENSKAQGESVLPITTLYQMVMGHSQYLTLMFNQEEQWERLKGMHSLLPCRSRKGYSVVLTMNVLTVFLQSFFHLYLIYRTDREAAANPGGL